MDDTPSYVSHESEQLQKDTKNEEMSTVHHCDELAIYTRYIM
jgi:hypothetical protein